jgi:opacity protein-like surface antigen
MKRILSTALAVAALALPLAAQAADAPSYAIPSGEDSVHGVISSFNGKYGLTVRDNRGYTDNVMMHQGTIINPTGYPLQAGMRVTIVGHADGDTFAANEIDTPVEYAAVPLGYGYGYYPATDWSLGFGYGRWGGFRGGFGGRW